MQTFSNRLKYVIPALLLGLVVLAPADAGENANKVDRQAKLRDPFWPLGYERPVVEVPQDHSTEQILPEPIPQEVESADRTITVEDWEAAEKAVGINPVKYAVGQRTGAAAFVLIGGQTKNQGELVRFDHKGVSFIWQIGAIERDRVRFLRRRANKLAED